MKPAVHHFAALCAAAVLQGCYFDRLTGNYEDTPAADEEAESAIIEESGHDEKTLAENEKRLREIAAESESVYRLNAGDEIEIRVYDHEDLGMVTRIGPDGNVGIAFMGEVKLSGLTIAEGANVIRDGIAPYVKNPVVSISVKSIASENATITGACSKPGVYMISNSTRVADLYAMAGSSAKRLYHGVDTDVADLENSIIVRNGERLPVDFEKAISHGDPLHNIRLRRGDYVFIAQRLDATVTVCGEIAKPQRIMFIHNMGLIETLAVCGWMMDAHWKHVIIIRDGLSNPRLYKVDVDGILAGKCRNIHLKEGDIVYVPKDNLGEYNVFVRKLLPTAQLINLATSRVTAFSN